MQTKLQHCLPMHLLLCRVPGQWKQGKTFHFKVHSQVEWKSVRDAVACIFKSYLFMSQPVSHSHQRQIASCFRYDTRSPWVHVWRALIDALSRGLDSFTAVTTARDIFTAISFETFPLNETKPSFPYDTKHNKFSFVAYEIKVIKAMTKRHEIIMQFCFDSILLHRACIHTAALSPWPATADRSHAQSKATKQTLQATRLRKHTWGLETTKIKSHIEPCLQPSHEWEMESISLFCFPSLLTRAVIKRFLFHSTQFQTNRR